MEHIRRIMQPAEFPDQCFRCGLLWSDPYRVGSGGGGNYRSVRFMFGPDVAAKFLHEHKLGLICQESQVVEGYPDFFDKHQLAALLSAPT